MEDYLFIYEDLHRIRNKPEGIRLLDIFQKHKEFDMIEMAKKLGYNEEKLNFNPVLGLSREEMNSEDRKNEQFEEVKAIILDFMEKHKRFPTYEEASVLPGMNTFKLNKFGGIHEIRRKMNITDRAYLIDDRGWPNKSSYEWTVAQFLIHNNVHYLREQKPFNNNNHRSDFTFYPEEGPIIHLELWGYDKTSGGIIAEEYSITKQRKIELYKEHDKEFLLVSLERSMFERATYDQIQSDLKRILGPILKRKLKEVEQEVIIPPIMLSNEQLLEEFLKYSNDGKTTPLYWDLPNNLRVAISKRYKSYEAFLKQYNFQPNKESTNVPIEYLFEACEACKNEDRALLNLKSYLERNKNRFKGFISKVRNNGGFFNVKLSFFSNCVEKGITVSEDDQMFLIGIAQKKITNITRQNEEQRIFAINILEKLGVDYQTIHFRHFNLRFTDEEVREIRNCKKKGATYAELSKKFQASISTIKEVLIGPTYSHIK
ncbi:hypothetical protein [Bacillus sp. ISL-77]|uniref:hypothetical protein n=1 Tax=Bacillus sp. ISL-77 TaxID=2819138 RepID=UPI001BE5B0E4|nr:hypothetical protein [Bacillus sp. ISL-77]MBT2740540.1 hypothetical protein [Bacillus sp. ISL-77]